MVRPLEHLAQRQASVTRQPGAENATTPSGRDIPANGVVDHRHRAKSLVNASPIATRPVVTDSGVFDASIARMQVQATAIIPTTVATNGTVDNRDRGPLRNTAVRDANTATTPL